MQYTTWEEHNNRGHKTKPEQICFQLWAKNIRIVTSLQNMETAPINKIACILINIYEKCHFYWNRCFWMTMLLKERSTVCPTIEQSILKDCWPCTFFNISSLKRSVADLKRWHCFPDYKEGLNRSQKGLNGKDLNMFVCKQIQAVDASIVVCFKSWWVKAANVLANILVID